MSLEPGLERISEFEVAQEQLTDVGGSLGREVLSTPSMISVMERNATVLVLEHLPEGRATVGFEVSVKHVAAARLGARCTVRATLREVIDGRRLRFEVEVCEGDRTIGVGIHERRVVEASPGASRTIRS